MSNKLVFWCCMAMISFAQGQQEIQQICIDPMGNRYEVYSQHLTKFNSAGTAIFSNGFPQLGSIHHLDLKNPLQPCLFFFDVQKILVIDNTLSNQNEAIDLSQPLPNGVLPYFTAACVAGNGGFWAFDNIQKKIIRLDPFGKTIFELAHLSSYQPLASWNILWMQESQNQLFLRDEGNLHCFDFTGAYLQSLPFPYSSTCADQGNVYEIHSNGLRLIYPFQLDIPQIKMPRSPFTVCNGIYYDIQNYVSGLNIQEFVNK